MVEYLETELIVILTVHFVIDGSVIIVYVNK